MKIQMLGDAIVITSALKTEDIQKTARFNSNALTLRKQEVEDGPKDPVFKILLGPAGGINRHGVIFDSTDDNGYARTTLASEPVAMTMQERVDEFASTHAQAIAYATELEAQVTAALVDIDAATATALESIEVVG